MKAHLTFAAIAALLCSFSFSSPALADPMDAPAATDSASDTPPPMAMKPHAYHKPDPQAMTRRVEQRITTLHDKLKITDSEEAEWSDVAKVMRDNESTMNQMIMARHKNPQDMTAIGDLQSYEDITQAHADGIKKMIVAFQTLYNDMPDDQKMIADKTFSGFEGHGKDKMAKKDM